jgi:hypothetical protein
MDSTPDSPDASSPDKAGALSRSGSDPQLDQTLSQLMARFELTVDGLVEQSLGPLLESTQTLDHETARRIARQTMLDRFREELTRLGASGALTPPASVAGSEADGEDVGGELDPDIDAYGDGEFDEYDEEEEEEWEEDYEFDDEAEPWAGVDGDDDKYAHWSGTGTGPETMAQFATRTAVAAVLAGADPLAAADAAVEATFQLGTSGLSETARAATPEPDVQLASAAAARMEALSQRAAAAEQGAEAAKVRMNSTLRSLGFTPRDISVNGHRRRANAAAPAGVATDRTARSSRRKYSLTGSASKLDDDDSPTARPAKEAGGDGAITDVAVTSAAQVAVAAAAAAAAARLQVSGMQLPKPELVGVDKNAMPNVAPRRLKPGGLMPPPEEKDSKTEGLAAAEEDMATKAHVDRRDPTSFDAVFAEEVQHAQPPQPPKRPNVPRSPSPLPPDSPTAPGMRRDKSWSRLC